MTPTNTARAERAHDALKAYVEAKGEVFENSRSEIADLIADLLHLIERDHTPDEEAPWIDGVIRATLDLARMHFDAEQADPEEQSGEVESTNPAKLIYMPHESTPTIATLGNREAIAYMELGEQTHYYGRLFAKAPEMFDKLLDIKILAESGDDVGYDPYTLLELIAQKTREAIALAQAETPPAES